MFELEKTAVPSVQHLRAEIFKEINSNRININWNAFRKTKEEKLLLKSIKQQHKKQIKDAGFDPKRYVNVPITNQ